MNTAKRQTIMVVDDTPANIQILYELLGAEFQVVFASSGEEALELVHRNPPDLILLDILMPEIDGYGVCRKLKEDPILAEIPVIFISALSEQADEILGLKLGAVDYISKPFNPEIVKLRVRNHLELKMCRDTLRQISLRDGLTDLANRRALDQYLEKEWTRGRRNRSELSLVMIDVDHFKSYNDAYGHLGGDDCLRQVAGSLSAALARPGDFLGRFGGEEFACILPETGTEGAAVTAERLRCAVESLKIPHAGSPTAPVVTISLGAATVIPGNQNCHTLIDKADQLLYRAKAAGRNRVEQDRKVRLP